MEALVDIQNLHLDMVTLDGVAHVLNGVNLTIHRGDLVGLVGETGCGKSLTAMSIPQLIPQPPARYTEGKVYFLGENVLEKSEAQLRHLRAHHIGVIFQDPMTGLNPVFTIEQQMVDAILSREDAIFATYWGLKWLPSNRERRRSAHERAVALLRRVGIPEPERRIHAYPHEFSGGMRQRVLIAMAIAGRPDLLLADEPTTALDVSVQAQILRLIAELVREIQLTVLLITHNIGVVAQLCNRIAIMYAGTVVEEGPVRRVLRAPHHPYTKGLLKAIPTEATSRGTLQGIPGSVPNLYYPPPGCRFAPRCSSARSACTLQKPSMSTVDVDHQVACVLYSEDRHQSL